MRAFGQTMCGFDILRSNGGSFICDVNGWASVKDSPKFWDDAANLLRQYCLQAVAPVHYSECVARSLLPSAAAERARRASHDMLETMGYHDENGESSEAAALASLLEASQSKQERLSREAGVGPMGGRAHGEEAGELLGGRRTFHGPSTAVYRPPTDLPLTFHGLSRPSTAFLQASSSASSPSCATATARPSRSSSFSRASQPSSR